MASVAGGRVLKEHGLMKLTESIQQLAQPFLKTWNAFITYAFLCALKNFKKELATSNYTKNKHFDQ